MSVAVIFKEGKSLFDDSVSVTFLDLFYIFNHQLILYNLSILPLGTVTWGDTFFATGGFTIPAATRIEHPGQ